MASEKLTALPNLAGGQVPTDLTYIVDLSAGAAGSSRSTLNDLFSEITKNITDGAVRFAGFAAPAVSAAGKGALYFSSADNTFKGSRNAGAYENLLFGSGGNTRVAVWNTGADQLTGYAEFVYQPSGSGVGNRVARLTVSGSGQDAQFYTDNTFASTPSSAGLTNLGALNLTRLTTGSFPIITMNQGRSGPAYPQSLDVLGVLRWRSTNNSVFNEAGYIQIVASENHTSLASGSGMEIWSTRPGNATATRRMIIGAGPIGQTIVFDGDPANNVTTNFGTNTRIAVGPPTTNDNNVRVIVSGSAGSSLKNLVLQAGSGQSANIFEAQSSAGTVLYSISAAGAVSFGGAQVITVSSANAFAVGPNGVTNPAFNVITNVASAATGLSITGNAAGSGVTLTALSSGTNEDVRLVTKGTGKVQVTTGSAADVALVTNYSDGTPRVQLGTYPGASTYAGGWFGNISQSSTNYSFIGNGSTELIFNVPSSTGSIFFRASHITNKLFTINGSGGVNTAVAQLPAGGAFGFSSSSDPDSTVDTRIRRNATANLALGATDAASPVAQTLSVQNATGTSNTAGVDWTFRGSAGTGTGATGKINFSLAGAGSSGTTQNSYSSIPVLTLDAAASNATGLSITGNAAGSGVTLTALSSASDENINLRPKNNGLVSLASTLATPVNVSRLSSGDASLTISDSGGNLTYLTQRSGSGLSVLSGVNGTSLGKWGGSDSIAVFNNNGSVGLGGTITSTSTLSGSAMAILSSGAITFPATNTATGTTGNQTINKVSGSVNFAAAATTLTVTNSLVTANSLVFCTILTNDGTATIKNVVPTAGSFTITLAAAATAETRVGFFVINQ